MAFTPRLSNLFTKITNIFQPKLHVAGLGRWGSTVSKEKKDVSWFHDTCNYDNCYTDMFNIIRFTTNNIPPNPDPEPEPDLAAIPAMEDIPNLPVHYALEMPPKISSG
jgi:hypothetical protein